uniref:Uncharacterized protein n=1 Tax=Oryza sativa subsp. japonica TaxID=39947 RepID=Q6UUA6_ORYSJ|nr:hypothetical protein OSJNBa0074N12.29 [Oryza sativa Japonica Group]
MASGPHSDRERQAYYMLSDREYAHTREYSPELLKKIGMDVEFRSIWKVVGWQRFAVKGISGFEKNRFWEDISGAPICKKPMTNDIHNPTLRLMHKWIAMTLFPRGDLRPIRRDELIIMFAMVRKIKIAPVKSARPCIDETYLVQGHILKHGVDGSLIYFFPGCTNEIPLPNAGYHLYNCHELTISLQTIEEFRVGGAYRETRNMTRNERESSSSSTPVQMYEAGWAPAGDAPGWTQALRHSIGVLTWASASEDRWRAPHDIQWGDNQPSRSSGVPPFLDMQMGEIQYNLMEHIAQTQEWQQSADAQFANFNNMMLQQHDDLQAYFRFQGFNPYQGS